MSVGISIICDNCGQASEGQSLGDDAFDRALREGFERQADGRDLCSDCKRDDAAKCPDHDDCEGYVEQDGLCTKAFDKPEVADRGA